MISMKKVRKIAMYGGSFDPIHNAHVNIAQAFIKKLKLDKLLFIPAGQAPHKAGSDAAPDRHRLAMCELAVKNVKKAEVSDIELKRQGKSYTADTLSELSQLYPDSELYLIMGADMFMTLDTWYKPEEIFRLAVICTVPRNDDDVQALHRREAEYAARGARTMVLDLKRSDISSTEIRSLVSEGKSISKLVCEDVERYIFSNCLYIRRGEVNYALYNRIIKSRMGGKRYIHSCNVADEAVRLAGKYGADEEKARIAGLLHDITKETPRDEQLDIMERYDVPLNKLYRTNPKLWHAMSGAAFVRCVLGIEDDDIFNAIRYHTSGRAGMSVLEKCIFIADFTSAERTYSGVDVMRQLADRSLEEAMRFGLSFSIADLAQKNSAIDPNALFCYNEIVMQLSDGKTAAGK